MSFKKVWETNIGFAGVLLGFCWIQVISRRGPGRLHERESELQDSLGNEHRVCRRLAWILWDSCDVQESPEKVSREGK